MSIPLDVNGVVFSYPVTLDEDWGDQATAWAQAVTDGMLQMQGGSFPLTANVNFGPNFGLLSQYFSTRSANPSTVGTVRLSSADAGIGWRNNANSGNLILTTNASDQLLYNGFPIATSGGGAVTSITGTANQIIASSPSGAVTLSTPQDIAATSSPTFASLTLTAPLSVANGGTGTTTSTGSGSVVLDTSPTLTTPTLNSANLITPALGTPSSGTLTNCVGLPIDAGTTGTLPVLRGGTGTTTSTGTGNVVLSTSPTLTSPTFVTPVLGTPASGTLTNCAGLPIDAGTTGTLPVLRGGTGTTTSTGTGNVVLSTSPTLVTPALGTPSSVTLTNATGLPIDAGTINTLPVARGGTGAASFTAYAVLAGGTTSTDPVQAIAGVGSAGQVLTSNGAGALPTFQNTAGSGTVNSGTATHLAYYATTSAAVSDASGATINGSYTLSGGAGALTLSGSTIAMGANKITGLAAGTAATDAANFGQIYYGFQAPVQGTTSTTFSTTSSSYQTTNLSATITPTSSSHRIKITVSGAVDTLGAGQPIISIFRGATDLDTSTNGFFQASGLASGATISTCLVYIDSPATTSSTTYSIKLKNTNNATTVQYTTGCMSVMTLEEIV